MMPNSAILAMLTWVEHLGQSGRCSGIPPQRPLAATLRISLTGIVASVVLLGYTTTTQPYFYALIGASLVLYVIARGEVLISVVVQYLTSRSVAWRWAFVAWAILSLLWTSRGGYSIDRAVTLLEIQIVGLVFFDAARNLGQARWILKSVLVCTMATALYALLSGNIALSDRLAGAYKNPNTLAIVSVIGLAVYGAGINRVKRIGTLLASYAIVLVLLAGIVASASRKGVLGTASVCVVGMILRQTRVRMAAMMVAVTAFSVVLVSSVEPLRLIWGYAFSRIVLTQSTLASSTGVSQSLAERARFIGKGLTLIAESPLLGRGLDTFRWLSGEGTYAHNNFVEVGVSVGIIGLILHYGFHASILTYALGSSHRGRFVGCFTLILVPTLLLLDIASVSYTSKLSTLLMIMCAGWLERTTSQ